MNEHHGAIGWLLCGLIPAIHVTLYTGVMNLGVVVFSLFLGPFSFMIYFFWLCAEFMRWAFHVELVL